MKVSVIEKKDETRKKRKTLTTDSSLSNIQVKHVFIFTRISIFMEVWPSKLGIGVLSDELKNLFPKTNDHIFRKQKKKYKRPRLDIGLLDHRRRRRRRYIR